MQADEGNQYRILCPIRQCKQPPTDISKNSHTSLPYSILGQLHMLCSNCIFHLLSSMAPICTIVKLTFSHSSEYFLFTSSNSSRAATERRVRCENLSKLVLSHAMTKLNDSVTVITWQQKRRK